MSAVKVLKPGLLDTIQDHGRFGYQQYGIPCSGAMDSFSFGVGNMVVGNDGGEAGIEVTLTGPKLLFEGEALFALTGGLTASTLNGEKVPMYRAIRAKSGDVLEIGVIGEGLRAYVCFAGGISIQPQLGSRSTYLLGKIGGLSGRPLQAGDSLPIASPGMKILDELAKRVGVPCSLIPPISQNICVRVILGPETDYFTEQAVHTLLETEYRLTSQSDRMGLRLEGEPIGHKGTADIISAGLSLGAIQVPGHGLPIIMMVDRQTTGGYPRIANVVSVDIARLAQLKPGGLVRFQALTVQEGHALIKDERQVLRTLNEVLARRNRQEDRRTVTEYQVIMDKKKHIITVEEM